MGHFKIDGERSFQKLLWFLILDVSFKVLRLCGNKCLQYEKIEISGES